MRLEVSLFIIPFVLLFALISCTERSNDEKLQKEIIGKYACAITYDDSDDDFAVFLSGKGTIEFGADSTCRENSLYTFTFIDENGNKSTLKYSFNLSGKYYIKNSYIVDDYRLENIKFDLIYSDNDEVNVFLHDHFISQFIHEIVTNTDYERIIELTEKYLKTETIIDGEKTEITHIRLLDVDAQLPEETLENSDSTNEQIADKASNDHTLKTYYNNRFNYSINYPSRLLPQGESDNNDGQVFLKSNEAELRVWGNWGGVEYENETLSDRYNRTLTQYEEDQYKTTYNVEKKDFFVISGYDETGNNIFYQKTVYNKENNLFITGLFKYDKTKENYYNHIIPEIFNSLLIISE